MPAINPEQEISVEVVTEPPPPPPEQKAEQPPPPPEEKPPQPPPPEKKPPPEPPKEKLTLDEKPAFDAPRAENKEKLDREAPDNETRAQKLARPNDQTAPRPNPQVKQKPQQERSAATRARARGDRAAGRGQARRRGHRTGPQPGPKTDKKPTKPDRKAVVGEQQKSIADMVASLAPVPNFQLGGAAKTAPISGGTAKPTYLSTVLGYIKRQYHPTGAARTGMESLTFYVDPNGNLVHQALRQSSGSAALDQAALLALRRAGPFPPTPTATSLGLIWKY